MTSLVKNIRFLALISFLSAALAYTVSINMELYFVRLHSVWLSNDYALTMFSGIFVSSFVVLILDIYDYCNQKYYVEQSVFGQYATLYGQFLVAQYNIKRILRNPQQFSPLVLRQQMPILKSLLNTIQTIDYALLFHRSHRHPMETMHKDFVISKVNKISAIVDGFVNLELAANGDEITLLKQNALGVNIAEMPQTHETLIKIEHQILIILNAIDQVLRVCENTFPKRFYWKKIKQDLIAYEENFVSADIKDFLKEDLQFL